MVLMVRGDQGKIEDSTQAAAGRRSLGMRGVITGLTL
jgi:hypothetical protein